MGGFILINIYLYTVCKIQAPTILQLANSLLVMSNTRGNKRGQFHFQHFLKVNLNSSVSNDHVDSRDQKQQGNTSVDITFPLTHLQQVDTFSSQEKELDCKKSKSWQMWKIYRLYQ